MKLMTFFLPLVKESFHNNSRNLSKINIYILKYSFNLLLFFNEDRFGIKIFTNEKCESNQFEVDEKMKYFLMKLFTLS